MIERAIVTDYRRTRQNADEAAQVGDLDMAGLYDGLAHGILSVMTAEEMIAVLDRRPTYDWQKLTTQELVSEQER